MGNNNFIKGGEIFVFADGQLYSKDAVFKCIYWYGDKFDINVTFDADKNFIISLKLQINSNININELEFYLHKLERDLIDFNLRDIVSKETQNIRDLLIAKAFSNGEFDELPPGDVSDPVGFNPS